MQLTSSSFRPDGPIPPEFAFGKIHPEQHFALSANRNPHLAWSDPPEGTRSLALSCVDSDVPTSGEDVNQEGRKVARELPRTDFCHWILIDIPAGLTQIDAGACSDGVSPRGKETPAGPEGSRQGVNDYTGWFAGDPEMAGIYRGYDGPAPPWNDELLHHYHFELYALDVERLPLVGDFDLAQVRAAIAGHVLGHAQLTGTYTLNPNLA